MIAWIIARPRVIVGAVLVALFAGWTVIAYRHGVKTERATWVENQRIAEAAARQTERDLAVLAERSAARIAEKERLLTERAKRHASQIRTILAAVPDCRVPAAAVGVLDAAAGVPATATVAGTLDADTAGLDASCHDTLALVTDNLAICRANVERLTEARDWYTDLRARVNAKE